MTTTTIRLDKDLKARVTAAAERAGKTAHAFMLDAIAETVEEAEIDAAFHALADERWADFVATGETVPWDEAESWLKAKARGENLPKPVARKLKL
jgi:predicted transcriptional regulator